ncbi:flagellar export chaperone FlgN [Eubacteriaceae bacterium ES2]|nr:flagellar export chaperone FlgN [Eubacteriaceae bacterium ES2]
MSETNTETIEQFYNYLFGVIKLHRDLIPKLKDELMLIESGSVEALTENINRQQGFVMQTKEFDKEISRYMKALNLEGKNVTEVVAQLPEEYHLRFYGLIGEFNSTVKEVQFYKEKCKILLETKLHLIEKKIESSRTHDVKGTYSESGKKDKTAHLPNAFEKKI